MGISLVIRGESLSRFAVATHMAHTYGGMRTAVRQARGGLAPWQVSRAQEMIDAGLDGNAALATPLRAGATSFAAGLGPARAMARHVLFGLGGTAPA